VLDALRSYVGAVVLVTHDPGAAEALEPQRVVLLPTAPRTTGQRYSSLIEPA
jgi:ATPase subunit of ABC transporter with duplicated ATPase domains